MISLKLIFWLLTGIVVYTYLGYGVLLWLLTRGTRRQLPSSEKKDLPRVAHIIAAYNEEDVIREKIMNTRQINYPAELTRILIVADGSTDKTADIVNEYSDITLLYQPERKGKVAAMNRAVREVEDVDILIFSDANSFLNPESFRLIVSHYEDPRVGGVSGEKKVISKNAVPGKGEGLYWKYESLLKKLDSAFFTVVGAAGELFSVRRTLFEPVPEQVLLDDLYISLMICRNGKLVRYEPGAFAAEAPSLSIEDERKRKIRISAGAFQSMLLFRDILNISRYGKLSFQYLSHRVLRWAVCPFALPLIFIVNLFIVLSGAGVFYSLVLYGQVVFYLLACIGWLLASKNRAAFNIFHIPYYFVFMNISVWYGLSRFLAGTQSVRWEKARRGV